MADAGTGAGMLAMAAASISVAIINAQAATDAATIQTQSAERVAAKIDDRFQQMRTDFEPYREIGVVATAQLTTRLNEFTSTANPYAAAMDAEMPTLPAELSPEEMRNTPGYQAAYEEGLRTITNTFAARGLDGSGAMFKALVKFTVELAEQTFNMRFTQQVSRFNMQQQRFANVGQRFAWDQGLLVNAYNRLTQVVRFGQASAAQVGAAGIESANQAGAAVQSGAAAAAAGILAGANATSGAVNGLANIYNSYQQQNAYGLNGGSSTYTDKALDAIDAGKWSSADQQAAMNYKDT